MGRSPDDGDAGDDGEQRVDDQTQPVYHLQQRPRQHQQHQQQQQHCDVAHHCRELPVSLHGGRLVLLLHLQQQHLFFVLDNAVVNVIKYVLSEQSDGKVTVDFNLRCYFDICI